MLTDIGFFPYDIIRIVGIALALTFLAVALLALLFASDLALVLLF